MLEPIEVSNNNRLIYKINFCDNYDCIRDFFVEHGLTGRRVCIVSDSNVSRYLLDGFIRLLGSCCKLCCDVVFQAGEENKHMGTIELIYERLIYEHFDRNDILIALGGGVTGDMTGFAAATYLRGIRFIQIPTSLLAMVDSSIGGKTGVDFHGYKNMIGAFHMPCAVFINTNVLNTLPEREYISGYAEIIKHSLIKDTSYLEYLRTHKDIHHSNDVIQYIIYRSCLIKRSVVEEDATEQGVRAHLNFGHTIGHAIEKYMDFKLLHGECVSLGCIAALYISCKRGLINNSEYQEARQLFADYRLPVTIDVPFDPKAVIDITRNDKKSDGNSVKFILLDTIGEAYIDRTVTDSEMLEALEELKGVSS